MFGDELWCFSLNPQNFNEMFIFVGERHDFIDVTLRHQVRDVGDTNIVNLPVWSVFTCNVATKNHEDPCTFIEVIVKR